MRKVLLALLAVYALGACGEREQVVEQQSSEKRYQGKRDSKPWDNDPLAYGSSGKWAKGDRTSWETQIKTRQQGQNEDRRIYQ
jgi:hypothetical protein